MVLMTALCIALGWIFYLKWQINALQGKCSKLSIDTTLYKTPMPHGLDPQMMQLMHDTNAVLRTRYDRLEALYEQAEMSRMRTLCILSRTRWMKSCI